MIYQILLFILPKTLFIRWFHHRIHHIQVYTPLHHLFKVRTIIDEVFHYSNAHGVIQDLANGKDPNDYNIQKCMTISCFATYRRGKYLSLPEQIKAMVEYDRKSSVTHSSKISTKIILK